MNRKLKFRTPVYSHSSKKFLHFYYASLKQHCVTSDIHSIISNDEMFRDEEQFTGLKDKNGNEFCEGDIFIDFVNKGYFIVIYSIEHTCFIGQHTKFKIDKNKTPFLQSLFWKYEIVGNIHENPEMLYPSAQDART